MKTSVIVAALTLASAAPPANKIQLYFSPPGSCTEAVVNQLNRATKSVLVQA